MRRDGRGEARQQCESCMLTGGQCDLEEGHDGPHQKQYPGRLATWTDEAVLAEIQRHSSRFD